MPRHFPDWLAAYMEYTKASEAPNEFHFWAGVSTIAGAVRRRVWIDQNEFQWTPNFYIIFVGPAGVVTKSTSLRAGQKLLEAVPGIKFGPQSMTWQALGVDLEDAMEYLEFPDPHTGVMQQVPMAPLTIHASELGTLLRMDDAQLISVLIDLWDGQQTPWKHKTKTSGNIEIRNPWINIIGCTTPSWLKTYFPEHMIGGGLTSRCIWLFNDKKRQYVPYPSLVWNNGSGYHDFKQKLVDDLIEISQLKGEFRLTKEAQDWGIAWYQDHWIAKPLHMASERYDGYRARKQTHLHKLAMVLSLARGDSLVLERDDLEKANMLLVDVEADMLKVFDSIGVVDEAKHVSELLSVVRAHKKILLEDLYTQVYNTMSLRSFEEAIKSAGKAQMLGIRVESNKQFIVLHPRIAT